MSYCLESNLGLLAPVGRYGTIRLLLVRTTDRSTGTHTVRKQQTFRVKNSDRVHCANAFVKSPFASVTFLAGFIFGLWAAETF
jgi:hypothetical protein